MKVGGGPCWCLPGTFMVPLKKHQEGHFTCKNNRKPMFYSFNILHVSVDQNEDVSDDDSSDSFSSHFRGYVYAVRIFDLVKGGELIFTLPISSSIFSMVRVPVQWLAPSLSTI